jgi:hypothetical protein
MPTDLCLDVIPEPRRRTAALEAWERGDVDQLMLLIDSHNRVEFVLRNVRPLREADLYESALLLALVHAKSNHARWPLHVLKWLLSQADRQKLRAIAPPPSSGPFELFRGVAGRNSQRRIRGISWTGSLAEASMIAAKCASWFGLPNPAVYSVEVPERAVLAYTNECAMQEFVVLLPARAKVARLAVQPLLYTPPPPSPAWALLPPHIR